MAAKRRGIFYGIEIAANLNITHLLFVDGILIFCDGTTRDVERLVGILELFGTTTGMAINPQKSNLTTHNMEDHEIQRYATLFPSELILLDEGLKYLGFGPKPNQHKKEDRTWLLAKLEKG